MELLFFTTLFFVFFLGAIFGSFLNVFAFELEKNVFLSKKERKNKKVKNLWERLNRRSACPHCHHKLNPWELVPLLSWLFLRGKCSVCSQKISLRYFLVELFSGILFLAFYLKIFSTYLSQTAYLNYHLWTEFIFLIPIISAIILIFLFDLKHKIIPDLVIIPAILYSLVYLTFDFQKFNFSFDYILSDIWRSLLFALPFFAIWLISKGRAMGFADWKLVFFLSLFLKDPMQNLLFVFGAFWVGAIYAIPSLIFKKSGLKSEVPFGPFIIISFLLVYLFNLSYYQFVDLLTF